VEGLGICCGRGAAHEFYSELISFMMMGFVGSSTGMVSRFVVLEQKERLVSKF
jgi:hypothetical protein